MDVAGLVRSLDSAIEHLRAWSPAAFGIALAAGLLLAFTPSNFALAPALVGLPPIKRHAMTAQKVSGALLAGSGILHILWRLAA